MPDPTTSAATVDSPQPLAKEVLEEGESSAFIPYAPVGENLEQVPISLRPDVFYYARRMGFLPNCIKLYLHVPWVAEQVMRLNNALMRDERNSLSEHLKYRLAMIASRDNECPYCVSHNAGTLGRRWGYGEDRLESLLRMEEPADEGEAVAQEFVHQACLDPAGVSDGLRSKLAEHFTPQEVMEIVFLVGFWKMYNTMHLSMAIPIEDPVQDASDLLAVLPEQAKR
jgi:alkylhydroperoxidase family enzyme